MNQIQTTLHYYRFDLTLAGNQQAYDQLRKELKQQGLRCFESVGNIDWYVMIECLNNSTITLETEHLFENQWNTAPIEGVSQSGLRLMDWAEAIWQNPFIKSGYYLEQTPEMQEARETGHKCRYCGAMRYKPQDSWCDKCLGSEYLTEEDLHLLYLTPVKQVERQVKMTPPASLVTKHKEQKAITLKKKLKQAQARKLFQLEEKIKQAHKEYDAVKFLIEHHIDTSDLIYYSHTDTFTFGWQHGIDARTAEKLSRQLHLNGFAVKYTFNIKTKS